jgi:hypothetical protein
MAALLARSYSLESLDRLSMGENVVAPEVNKRIRQHLKMSRTSDRIDWRLFDEKANPPCLYHRSSGLPTLRSRAE